MIQQGSQSASPIKLNSVQVLAWGGTILLSILPDILFREITGIIPEWLYGVKLSLIALLLLLSLFWTPAKNLQRYFLVFLAIFLIERAWQAVAESPQWLVLFPAFETGFLFQLFSIQLGRLVVALVMIGSLFFIGFKREETFVGFGNLSAPASPMPIIGVEQPTNWRSLGFRLTLYAFLILLVIMMIFYGNILNPSALSTLLPALPMIILLAAMNSFSEEVTYRAALLAPIHKILGVGQAVWITAAFFGIGHFYGVPAGILGILVNGFFGWILARSMVETKGLFWPWFIHLWVDVVIFSFMAIGALQGGS